MNSRLKLAMMGAMVMSQVDSNCNPYPKPRYFMPDGGNGFSTKIPKAVDSRQFREFSIKGHKVMAYSRKDAITRLKHLKKI